MLCARRRRRQIQWGTEIASSSPDRPETIMDFSHLLPESSISQLVRAWLSEDIPSFDYGGAVVGDKVETATLWGKARGVLAAVPFFNQVFAELDCK